MADDGYLGNPLSLGPRGRGLCAENDPAPAPAARSSSAPWARWPGGSAVRASYRYFWDNWAIRAHTVEAGYSRYVGESFLIDGSLRLHSQGKALFYSDNAVADTLYLAQPPAQQLQERGPRRQAHLHGRQGPRGGHQAQRRLPTAALRTATSPTCAPARPMRSTPTCCSCLPRPASEGRTRVRALLTLFVIAVVVMVGGPISRAADAVPAPVAAAKRPADVASAPRHPKPLDQRVEAVKGEVIRLNRDLLVLEEELLFPRQHAGGGVHPMDVGKMFELDSLQLKVDDKLVASHLYSPLEVQALPGAACSVYLGNPQGRHATRWWPSSPARDRTFATTNAPPRKFEKGADPSHRAAHHR